MKVQELMEMNDNSIRLDTYEEYKQFFENKSRDDSMYHFEDVTGQDGNEYDILVKVYNFNKTRGSGDMASAETPEDLYGSTEVDWNIVAYGSGDFDTDTNFWVKEGRLPVTQGWQEHINDKIIEDQSY